MDDFLSRIFAVFVDLATWLVSLLPEVDASAFAEWVSPAQRLVCWLSLLDEAAPVTEVMVVFGAVGVIYGMMYGVMMIRRLFSLVWPGAGS